jgi:hypothetical protein
MSKKYPKLRIMIIIPHYWGKGDTITEAWKQVKKESGKTLRSMKSDRHQIYVCWDTEDVSTSLDEFGFNITYPDGYPPVKIEEK